jgi:hypothetical protein
MSNKEQDKLSKYKVYGGLTFHNGKQVRTIVATKTKKKAIELLHISAYHFNDYWCETGNKIELEAALLNIEKVLIATTNYPSSTKDFVIKE